MKIHAQGTCDFLAAIRAYEGDYELKFDGCRAIGFKTHNRVHLASRNGKDFSHRFPALVLALEPLADERMQAGLTTDPFSNSFGGAGEEDEWRRRFVGITAKVRNLSG